MNKFERNMLERWKGKQIKTVVKEVPVEVIKKEFTCLDKDSYVEYLEHRVIELEKELNGASLKNRYSTDIWGGTSYAYSIPINFGTGSST